MDTTIFGRAGIEQDNTDIWVILILVFIYSVMVHTIFDLFLFPEK
jgi:hypothetical protein